MIDSSAFSLKRFIKIVPHQEFCVDVSAYQPVKWIEKDDEVCDTEFVKRCSDRKENVCADVLETSCEVTDPGQVLYI